MNRCSAVRPARGQKGNDMKRAIIVILILAQLFMLAACSRTKEPREIDALTEYSLADLQSTFESTESDPSDDATVLYYRDVHFDEAGELFGSYVLRRVPSSYGEVIYTAYRVESGGVYYVKWSAGEDGMPDQCTDRMFLNDLPAERELARLHKGDPYSKLERIDGGNRFVMRSGLRPIAYSVARTGKVFGFELDLRNDGNYGIVKITDCTGKGVFPALILKEDLPQ